MHTALLMLLTGAICPAAPESKPKARPNVLLIVSDDHWYDALGCAGHPIVRTPNLDRLASQGVRFTHAFVEIPICTPSRAAFLSGRYGPGNGVTFFSHKIKDVAFWPEVLTTAGYQTAATGKWHNDGRPGTHGFSWTRNVFLGGMCDYTDPKLIQGLDDKPQVVKGNITELITDAAVGFLAERDQNRPFFLYVAYTAPHDPRTPPPRYEQMYPAAKMPLPDNFMSAPPFDPGTLDIRDEKLLDRPLEPSEVRREIGRYYGLITHLDSQVGRILKELDERNLDDNTIVVFMGDNGLTLGSHGLLGKQTLYDEGVRVPLIIRHPAGRLRGEVRDALVGLLDIFPTVCEWTKTPTPEGLDGRSLAALYAGSAPKVRDEVYGRYDNLFRSVRTDRYKLIQYLALGKLELFDIQKDPLELNDLADDPAMKATRDDLLARLMKWREVQNDLAGER